MTSQGTARSLVSPQRITQLQCGETNSYLQGLFAQWLAESFKFQPWLFSLLQDEIELALAFAEYALTVRRDHPQPGDLLQNIRYAPMTQTQKLGWLLLTVLLPYLTRKIAGLCSSRDSPFWRRAQRVLRRVQSLLTVLELVNFGVFIRKGEYRSLAQRILGIRMAFADPQNKRVLNFALMNRTLVWQVYELFLRTVLPQLFSLLGGPLKNLFYMSSYLEPDSSSDSKTCVFCASERPVMPQRARKCGHLGCYYCCGSHPREKCPRCGEPIEQWEQAVK